MDQNRFQNSAEFDDIFNQLIQQENPSFEWIKTKWNLSTQKTKILLKELELYRDDEFLMNVLSELRLEDEPPTISRIMGKYRVSYTLAEKIFGMYMEDC